MHRSRRGLAAALACAVLAGGCSLQGSAGSEPPKGGGAPAYGPISMAGRAPLTGRLSAADLRRPAITVKISNTPDAHPHRGLGNADIVFVEPIANATTRLAAIFHSQLPQQVGPVRSLRPMDAPLIGPTKGVIANTMAANWVLSYLDKVADLDNLGTLRTPRGTYRIDNSRRAPNHAFARLDRLRALTDRTAPPAPYFDYAPDGARSSAQRAGRPARGVTIGYGGSSTASWTFEPRSGRWFRSEQWSPHRLENGRQVSADNVMVLSAARDRSFPIAGRTMTIPDVIDAAGTLRLFTGNKLVEGRWTKGAVNEPFRFTTNDGSPLLLAPGTTWIEIAFTDTPVRIR